MTFLVSFFIVFMSKLIYCDWIEYDRIVSHDNTQYFGGKLLANDDTLLVTGSQSVFVFKRDNNTDNWVEADKLVATKSDTPTIAFGLSVAFDDTKIIVGAMGSVHVFTKNISADKYDESYVIIPPDSARNNDFGKSLVLYNDILFIGYTGINDYQGRVYVYEYDRVNNEWVYQQNFTGNNTKPGSTFGYSIVFDDVGNRLFIGAHGNEKMPGVVYIYKYDSVSGGWYEFDSITDTDINANTNEFGYTIVYDGKNLLITAVTYARGKGVVYVFNENIDGYWEEIQKLECLDCKIVETKSNFGWSVAKNDDYIFVGAWGTLNFSDYDGSGSVYIFDYNGTYWNHNGKFRGFNRTHQDEFGFSLEISQRDVFVGTLNLALYVYKTPIYTDNPTVFPTNIPSNAPSISPTNQPTNPPKRKNSNMTINVIALSIGISAIILVIVFIGICYNKYYKRKLINKIKKEKGYDNLDEIDDPHIDTQNMTINQEGTSTIDGNDVTNKDTTLTHNDSGTMDPEIL